MPKITPDESFLRKMGLKTFEEREAEAAANAAKEAETLEAKQEAAEVPQQATPVAEKPQVAAAETANPKPEPAKTEKPRSRATAKSGKAAAVQAEEPAVKSKPVMHPIPVNFRIPQELLDALDEEVYRRNRGVVKPSDRISRSDFILEAVRTALGK